MSDATPPQNHEDAGQEGLASDEGNQRLCPNGHPVDSDLAFCTECGSPVGSTCPAGHHNPPGYAYCGNCGAPLAGASNTPPDTHSSRRWWIAGATALGIAAIVAVTLVVTNASDDSSTDAASTSAPASIPTSTTTSTSSTTTSTTTPPASSESALVFDGTGIGIVDLGDPEAGAYDTLVAAFGNPTADESASDCPEGPSRFLQWGNLYVTMNGGQFVAYSYRNDGQAPAGVTNDPETPEGVHVGSTVSDLQVAYGSELTIGNEEFGGLGDYFEVGGTGGLSGELTGPGPSDEVESIGANLFFCL